MRRPSGPRDASWSGTVIAAALITAASAPGQTAGLSPFTDPIIEQLGVSRTDISVSYLIGTLVGAAALPFIGRALDRWGARSIITAAVVILSATLFAMSFVVEIYGLTAGFIFLRMAGQGTLTLAATTAVVKAIRTRRGLALGITAAVGSAGISLTPVLMDRLISAGSIQTAWRYQAVAVLLIVLPMVLLLPRHRAQARADTSEGPETTKPAVDESWTTGRAARAPIFWAIAAALAATGMLTTGLAFHQISILTSQGLSSTAAAANFIPQTIAGILATLAAGAFSHRLDPRYSLAGSMVLLALALCFLPFVAGVLTAMLYGLALGAAAGALRAVEPIALAHYFGTESIGGIRGIITAINVGSTALGPILFSIGRDLTGNYTVPSIAFAALPIAVAITALLCPVPGQTHRLLRRRLRRTGEETTTVGPG